MKLGVGVVAFLPGLACLLLTAGAAPCSAQINIHIHTATGPAESHIGDLTGHSEAGKQLYRRFCIGCHGPNGDGKGENAPYLADGILPRDFTAGLFKCRSTPSGSIPQDSDLFETVGRGLVTTGMPSWGPLTDQDRADLVAFIKTFSPRFGEEKPDKPISIPAETADTAESQMRGEELYQKTLKCFECHGKSGRGDGPSAPTLRDNKGNPIPPYDFTTGSRFKCGATNADLYRIFMTGLDGTPMPAWSDWVSPDQGWDLVHYLRTLQVNYKAGKSNPAPSSGEKSKDNTAKLK
jgi:cytochrome c oxidase cbb3-type subunit I/II